VPRSEIQSRLKNKTKRKVSKVSSAHASSAPR
jgi:hypothetical protein